MPLPAGSSRANIACLGTSRNRAGRYNSPFPNRVGSESELMFVVNSLPLAIVFCVITMLGWGSWANTQQLACKEAWPFQLFYCDYAIGVFLFSIVFAHTFGSFGTVGMSAR